MSSTSNNVNLDADINFIKTPAPKPSAFGTKESCGVPITDVSLAKTLTRLIEVLNDLSHPPSIMHPSQPKVLAMRASPTPYCSVLWLEFQLC